MDFLSDILGFGASVASGGIFGLVGSAIGAVGKYFQRKQEMAWKREEWDREERMFELQMQARVQETENEIALASAEGAWKGLSSSIRADARSGASYAWVNAVKSLFRPVLTTGLFVLVYLLWNDLHAAMRSEESIMTTLFEMQELKDMMRYIVYSCVFAASTAGVWWFGDRAFAPPGMKNR